MGYSHVTQEFDNLKGNQWSSASATSKIEERRDNIRNFKRVSSIDILYDFEALIQICFHVCFCGCLSNYFILPLLFAPPIAKNNIYLSVEKRWRECLELFHKEPDHVGSIIKHSPHQRDSIRTMRSSFVIDFLEIGLYRNAFTGINHAEFK